MSERQLVRSLLYLHQQLQRAADDLPMTMSQYFMLHFLHEEPRRAADFTVVSKLRKPGVTALVGRLEARGWIRRSPDPDDGRAYVIHITEAGLIAFHDFEAQMQTALERFLGDELIRETDALLDPFYRAWNRRRIERFNRWRERRCREA
ncbi:MAG: MarR family transcriptional regulator [Pseudomonadales bacterium]